MKLNIKTANVAALAIALSMAIASSPALAADLASVNTFLGNIQTMLKGVAIAVVTIAFMVAGYKVVFGGSTVREVVPIVIGGLIIGAASYFAGLIVE